MRDKYFPSKFRAGEFHCIWCGVFASQTWYPIKISTRESWIESDVTACICSHCSQWSYWFEHKMVIPADSPVEPPHTDLPEDCAFDYCEAREVFSKSPRAAAALLRLCIQKLMVHLGEKGANINADIKSLVAKGLSPTIQQSLDYCRVVGNNAVHPGEIDLKDSPEIAQHLFSMINFIVEVRISHPKEIERLYKTLPAEARDAVEKRDAVSAPADRDITPAI
jgi:hypothetical protein